MNNLENENVLYSLQNKDNYKKNIECNLKSILSIYNSLINDYLTFVSNIIKFENTNYYMFIIERGLDTLSHVFVFILLYSKNIDMAYHHSQRSYYLYVEFITQISNSYFTHLDFNSQDAVIYVYKKTIFDVKKEFIKKMIFNY